MASEERRTKSTEELIKELRSAVWNYGAAGRDNIIKKYGVEAYKAAQTAIDKDRYYRLRESREYKKHGRAVRERITKKEYLAIKKITQEYIARCNKSGAEE